MEILQAWAFAAITSSWISGGKSFSLTLEDLDNLLPGVVEQDDLL